MLAPIVLFAYLRIDTLQAVVASLQKNELSSESDLFIFCDGVKTDEHKERQKTLVEFIYSIKGFKSVTIKISKFNRGLDPSIIMGVTEIVNKFGKVIVLEDDVVVSPNFLLYMNQCLEEFELDSRIMSISGWGIDINKPQGYPYDVYLFGRSSSWGWATWADRWNSIDWEIKEWNTFSKNKEKIKQFNKRGGSDMFHMLKECMNGGNMWDIRFCYNMFVKNMYSIIPVISKTENIGYNDLAVHCKPVKFKRFRSTLDKGEKKKFILKKGMEPNMQLIKQRLKISSFYVRVITKLRNIIRL